MFKVGIVGATGYTGVELLRLLAPREDIELTVVTSREMQGISVARHFPNLRGHLDMPFSAPETASLESCDLVFFATPHAVAMNFVRPLLEQGVRVIDVSADFRLKDITSWEHWYKTKHVCPDLAAEAVYGLPEVNREAIRKARLVANPGCYPTAVQLGLLPLLENDLVECGALIADCKSGVSGAGRKAAVDYLFTESADSIKAYAVSGHRHLPEILQGLNLSSRAPVRLSFIPHLTPMIRGILATVYAPVKSGVPVDGPGLQAVFEDRYASEPFVDVLPAGEYPATRNVKGGNYCQISVNYLADNGMVVILSAIDNLVKGASGQAIQNMNIMLGLDETAGLKAIALLP
ncbi:MAG: N-acetyl-gamma-glutamyl-phosphate reductase [Pseudohongiellaceae bacterium]